MDADFIQRMKQSLNDMKAEILSNLSANHAEFKQIAEGEDPKDVVDIASDDIDRKMLETMGAQDIKRMKLIENALLRIEQGKYGLCLRCGKKIPQERLEAIPYAFMCIECKNADERQNR